MVFGINYGSWTPNTNKHCSENFSVYGMELSLRRSLSPFILSIYLPSSMVSVYHQFSVFLIKFQFSLSPCPGSPFSYLQTLSLPGPDCLFVLFVCSVDCKYTIITRIILLVILCILPTSFHTSGHIVQASLSLSLSSPDILYQLACHFHTKQLSTPG